MTVKSFTHHRRPASRVTTSCVVRRVCQAHAGSLYRLALLVVGDADLAVEAVVDVLAAAVESRTPASYATSSPVRFAENRFALAEAVYRRCLRMCRPGRDGGIDGLDEDQRVMIGLIVFDTRDPYRNPPAFDAPDIAGRSAHRPVGVSARPGRGRPSSNSAGERASTWTTDLSFGGGITAVPAATDHLVGHQPGAALQPRQRPGS